MDSRDECDTRSTAGLGARVKGRGMVVVSPTSPGGTDVTRAEWQRVEALCAVSEEELRTAKLAARAAAEKGR